MDRLPIPLFRSFRAWHHWEGADRSRRLASIQRYLSDAVLFCEVDPEKAWPRLVAARRELNELFETLHEEGW